MSLIPLGFFGAGGSATLELIQTQVLSSATPSVTFSSLSAYASTYKHLQLRMTIKTDRSGGDSLAMRINGDTGANYSQHWLRGYGGSVQSGGAGASQNWIPLQEVDGTSTAGVYSAHIVDILDAFNTSKNKTVRQFHGRITSPETVYLLSGAWYNTSAISSLTILSFYGANLVSGARVSLYGVKG